MTPLAWVLVAVAAGLALVALALVYAARAVLELADVLGHDHDTRWHVDDPVPLAPHEHPEGLAGSRSSGGLRRRSAIDSRFITPARSRPAGVPERRWLRMGGWR